MTVQIILKNSSVVDKRPAATQLANGELSLNYNEAGAFLCCVDSAGNVQQVGGVKISADAPGSPVRGTMWLQPATSTLFIYNGTAWLSIAGGGGGGGGGGDITQVLGGDGITTSELSGVVTVSADIDTDRGLNFVGGQIAINPGANISFDAQGRLRAEASALAYRGTVDLVAGAVPADPTQGDTHANIVNGDMSADWQTATGEGATQVAAGDLVVWNGTIWTYIPTGGVPGDGTDLTVDGRTATTLDIASSTGDDATVPAATDALAGLMTAADKAKLDDVEDDAQANVQADWNETDVDSDAFIQNKPTIPAAQVQSNWTETDNTDPSFIQNKPTIPAAQVQSNWDETDTLEPSFIQNKPDLTPTGDGDFGYWSRTGTSLSPATAGDDITTTGDVGAEDGTFSGQVTVGGNTTLSAAGAITTPAVTLDPGTTGSPLVRDSNGRVGIGVDTPISELHIENADQAHISVQTTSSNMAKFGSRANDVYIAGTSGSANIIFRRNVTGPDHPADSGIETARIDGSGRLLVGTSADGTGRRVQVEGTDFASSCLSTRRESDNDGGSAIELYKSRGNSFEIVSDNDELGYIRFYGSQGTADAEAARIRVDVDGAPSATSMPGRLLFYTTPSGSTAPSERLRIDSDGAIRNRGGVFGNRVTIADNTAWDLTESNFWLFTGGVLANPTNTGEAQSGLIFCTGAITGYGGMFQTTPNVVANQILPYYISSNGVVRLGTPVTVG